MVEEEIDLREIINLLLKRRYLIISVTVMAVLIAAIISYSVLPPVYRSVATFKIAMIDSEHLFDINDIENRMKSDNILKKVNDELKLNRNYADLSGFIKIENLNKSSYFIVSAEYSSAERARDIVLSTMNQFIEMNKPHYRSQIMLLENEKKSVEMQMELEKKNMEEVEKLRFDILKSDDLSLTEKQIQINLLLNYSIQIRDSYNELVEKYYILENQIINSNDFEIIKYPSLPQSSIKPNKKLNMAISGVLGLFLGVFIAFFAEFWQSNR